MKAWLFFLLIGALVQAAPFRLSLTEPPRNLDPHLLRSSSGQYVIQQLYRNFFRFNQNHELVPELGESCQTQKTKWICQIKPAAQWHDGTPITAQDFKKSWQRILTLPSPRADLLFAIQNAQAIFEKRKTAETLGVRIVNEKTFEIQWEKGALPTSLFLMSPLFVPLQNGELNPKKFSGPYQLSSTSTTEVSMGPNSFYYLQNRRPALQWVLIDENLTVQAFEKKQIDFLRRVPTSLIPQKRALPGFFQTESLRLDSLFFGPQLLKNKDLREQLITSLNYTDMQKLFNSTTRPGCMGVPLLFYSGDEICYTSRSPEKLKSPPPSLEFRFSSLGGEDHRRLAEWLQNQWQEKLALKVTVQGLENKIFLAQIEQNPPSIYRRGLSPEWPTCSGVLESFHSKNPDNRSQVKDQKLDQLIEQLQKVEMGSVTPTKKTKELCKQSLLRLKELNQNIPTGRIFFSFMIQPQWGGLDINLLNHLDLGQLELKP